MSEEKPKWKKLSEIVELLSNNSGLKESFEKAESLNCMDSTLAYALTGIIQKVPKSGFELYSRLIQKACTEGCLTNYNTEKFYVNLINLIEDNYERIKFLKSVLNTVDKEVCRSDIALPSNHPYLEVN